VDGLRVLGRLARHRVSPSWRPHVAARGDRM